MKRLIILFLLSLIPYIVHADVTYSGATIFSVTTSGDFSSMTVSFKAGCVINGITVSQANKLNLFTISRDSATGSAITTSNSYDSTSQTAIVTLPEVYFTVNIQNMTESQSNSYISRIIMRRMKGYAEEIINRTRRE